MKKLLILSAFVLAVPAIAAVAQTPAPQPSAAQPGGAQPAVAVQMTKDQMAQTFRGSFFLSPLEIETINDALSGHAATGGVLDQQNKAVAARRVIRIGGVLYRSPSDWVVWMNNKKVTPNNLLPEILDISVRDTSKVSLKWYDVGLNKVILITLRPHQVYDITTGVLLPGTQSR